MINAVMVVVLWLALIALMPETEGFSDLDHTD